MKINILIPYLSFEDLKYILETQKFSNLSENF